MALPALQSAEELACVLVSAENGGLLLPNSCVAEILPWRRVKPMVAAPRWCVASLGWRGHSIVVVDFQVMAGLGEPARSGRRSLVVINRVGERDGAGFYAFAVSTLPRLVHLAEDEIRDCPPDRLSPAILSRVMVGTEELVIPNLRYIEDEVARLL
ncbi:MAG: chemotaxis protein CheW [Pseudomonadales bacterium]|nr:chemotaxis protein CheW [Pseudomonadales bacterium]MCP5183408.1 chemotaxis protein CheW [Pseudomonadales bacterium]